MFSLLSLWTQGGAGAGLESPALTGLMGQVCLPLSDSDKEERRGIESETRRVAESQTGVMLQTVAADFI